MEQFCVLGIRLCEECTKPRAHMTTNCNSKDWGAPNKLRACGAWAAVPDLGGPNLEHGDASVCDGGVPNGLGAFCPRTCAPERGVRNLGGIASGCD